MIIIPSSSCSISSRPASINSSSSSSISSPSVFEIENTEGLDIEELELELIDAGLEEIEQEEDGMIIMYGDYTSFGTLQEALEERKIEEIGRASCRERVK